MRTFVATFLLPVLLACMLGGFLLLAQESEESYDFVLSNFDGCELTVTGPTDEEFKAGKIYLKIGGTGELRIGNHRIHVKNGELVRHEIEVIAAGEKSKTTVEPPIRITDDPEVIDIDGIHMDIPYVDSPKVREP